MQAVNGIGGYRYGRIETKRNVGSPHVIVDGFGNAYHIYSRFGQFRCCFLRTVSSDAHDAVQAAFADGLKHDGRFVLWYGTRFSFERFFAWSTKDGSSQIEKSCQWAFVQRNNVIVQQSPKTTMNSINLHPVMVDGCLAYPSNGGIDSRTVASWSQDSYLHVLLY